MNPNEYFQRRLVISDAETVSDAALHAPAGAADGSPRAGGWVKAGRSPSGGAEFITRLPGSPIPPEEELDDEELEHIGPYLD